MSSFPSFPVSWKTKEAVIHFGWRPLVLNQFVCAGRYPVSVFAVIRPIRMVIVVGIRLELGGMKPEKDIPDAHRPGPQCAAMADRDCAFFSILRTE
jgi:hypothetical protein